jgi:glutaconate CoA-transferase subunit A
MLNPQFSIAVFKTTPTDKGRVLMVQTMELSEAIEHFVKDGDALALEGFTHLIPMAAGQEIIRQGKKDLTLIRMTPDLIYDQMIGMGCAKKLVFSWGGNPGVGSLHRLRDAIERGWPRPLDIEEYSHAAMACAFAAGASNIPFGVLKGFHGVDLTRVNNNIRQIDCPFTGEVLAAVPSIRPDVSIIHAQRADRAGNVVIEGIVGVQKEAALSAKCAIVTVEEVVDDLGVGMNGVVLPGWALSAVCVAKGGARPSYTHGYYVRDNASYVAWDKIARDRKTFLTWMDDYVMKRDSKLPPAVIAETLV